MRQHRVYLLMALAALGVGVSLWGLLAAWLIGSTLEAGQQESLWALLAPRLPLLALAWLLGLMFAAFGLRWLIRRYIRAPLRLAEQVRMVEAAQTPQQLPLEGAPEYSALAAAVNQLVSQRDALRADVGAQIAEASHRLQQEKNRLAALVSELNQSVVVCNLDGRIVLYNNRARLQFRTLSPEPTLAEGAELIGIGRSIYAVLDQQLVAHALEHIHQRLARGAASPATQFVTVTASGQLLRVQMAPVRSGAEAATAADGIGGFVLLVDNVTHAYEEQAQRDQTLHALTDASRTALAGMQFAVNRATVGEGPAPAQALAQLRTEMQGLSERLSALTRTIADGRRTTWPLEDMLGDDLLSVAQRRIETQCGCPVSVVESQTGLWVRVDSFHLLQALSCMAERLVDEFEVKFLQLRLRADGERVNLDLIWSGHAMSSETVMTWKMDPMIIGGKVMDLTVRDVVERHGGDMLFERERVRHQACFRFQLPPVQNLAQIEAAEILHADSRPEFYDFDLFQSTDESRALDERPLAALAYTVFDTETTGLQPSAGDEIIQLGAVRIVNAKLLRHESFDQLVDPGRPIPAASIPIHGITQDMVRGKRRIAEVLPAFHAFARDTVLVAHNAAFDMRFLQLKEASVGVAFHQPVLDTLLLSALVHPAQDSHRLEAIAERFHITVLGRHTALGDALVTAEVLLRLIPLLQAMGIDTLRQAREATQNTYLARLKY